MLLFPLLNFLVRTIINFNPEHLHLKTLLRNTETANRFLNQQPLVCKSLIKACKISDFFMSLLFNFFSDNLAIDLTNLLSPRLLWWSKMRSHVIFFQQMNIYFVVR